MRETLPGDRVPVEEVPSVAGPPPGAEPSLVWVPFDGWSRRRALAALGGAAMASGLGLLGLFPWARPGKAFAEAYTAWPTCRGYYNAVTTCVPSNAYFDQDNCAGEWHRGDSYLDGCEYHGFTHDPTSCDGNNAWRWDGPNARGDHRMCSDGWYDFENCAGDQITRFSVCRTEIP
jgi:hypothetical protein